MKNFLITSYLDDNYYIIDNNDFNIFTLATIFLENEEYVNYTNYLLEYREYLNELDLKLFVYKDSDFGCALSQMIREGEIYDERNMIREEILLNALINSIQNNQYSPYLFDVISLIRNNDVGNVDKLSSKYDRRVLENIIKIGKSQSYFKSLNCQLTGYEKNGLIVDSDMIYQFNIETKVLVSLPKNDIKKKERKFS